MENYVDLVRKTKNLKILKKSLEDVGVECEVR